MTALKVTVEPVEEVVVAAADDGTRTFKCLSNTETGRIVQNSSRVVQTSKHTQLHLHSATSRNSRS